VGAFSPRGDLLVTSQGGRLRSWDIRTGREVARFDQVPPEQLFSGTFSPPALSFSADGRFLARAEGGLWLYEVASERVAHRFPGGWTAAAFSPSGWRLAAANERHFDVLVWDLKALFLAVAPRPAEASLAALWAGLADRDPAVALGAAWRMADAAGMERLLSGRLLPVPRADPAWLRRRIAELGSDDFGTRQRAERSLADAGDAAGTAMREALGKSADLEQSKRLVRLLARLDPRTPERLRQCRAVLALEARGSEEARRLLVRLAGGMPGAELTEEAKAALSRTRP
jgi:hypothetical protein